MTTIPTFWNNEHLMCAEYKRLHALLVPKEGPAETMEGELLRAASKIGWDWGNNGFGNNWSGALVYLSMYLPSPLDGAIDFLYPFATGDMPDGSDSEGIWLATNELMEGAIEAALDAERAGAFTKNPCNMYDLQRADMEEDEDENLRDYHSDYGRAYDGEDGDFYAEEWYE
jgi:hypothetical protein